MVRIKEVVSVPDPYSFRYVSLTGGRAEVEYQIGEIARPPQWLEEKGYGILVFRSLDDLRRWRGGHLPNENFSAILEVEVNESDRIHPLPPILELTALQEGEIVPWDKEWPEGTEMYSQVFVVGVKYGLLRKFKVVALGDKEGCYYSLTRGLAQVEYFLGEWATAPEWLAARGYYPTVFSSFDEADEFAREIPVRCAVIAVDVRAGDQVPLPPRLCTAELEAGEMKTAETDWLSGTEMYRAVRPAWELARYE